jgi:hypothetical protein
LENDLRKDYQMDMTKEQKELWELCRYYKLELYYSKVEKLINHQDPYDLLYTWIKQDVIGLKVFRAMVKILEK